MGEHNAIDAAEKAIMSDSPVGDDNSIESEEKTVGGGNDGFDSW